MLGPIIAENDPPLIAPWVTLAHQSCKKSEALEVAFNKVIKSKVMNLISILFLLHCVTSGKCTLNQPSYIASNQIRYIRVHTGKFMLNSRTFQGLSKN